MTSILAMIRSAALFLWQPVQWFFEFVGMVRPALVATLEVEVFWPAVTTEDGEEEAERAETITFFLFQHPSGRRFYRSHTYGKCWTYDTDDNYAAPVLMWVYGGPLPVGAKLNRTSAEIIPLREVQKN